VHHLSHRLAAGIDGNHVIAWIDQISKSAAPEKPASSTSTLSTCAGGGATDRHLSRAKIDFPRRATASLPAPPSASSRVGSARRAQ
jgi:hypothetical protein